MILLLFVIIAIGGVAKAIMDILQFNYNESIFYREGVNKFWDTRISWSNKYEPISHDQQFLIRRKWFGFIKIPVLFTDGWHLFQSIFLTSIFTGICLYKPIFCFDSVLLNVVIDFFILRAVFGLFFILFYNILFRQ